MLLASAIRSLPPAACIAAPMLDKAKPKSNETSTTLRIFPRAKASTTVLGIIWSRKSFTVWAFACPAYVVNRSRVRSGRIGVKTCARWNEVADQDAEYERKRRDDFKIQQRLASHSAHFLEVPHPGNTRRHSAEDHQSDNHRDEPNESIAERTHRCGCIRPHVSEHNRKSDSRQNLNGKIYVECFFTSCFIQSRGSQDTR